MSNRKHMPAICMESVQYGDVYNVTYQDQAVIYWAAQSASLAMIITILYIYINEMSDLSRRVESDFWRFKLIDARRLLCRHTRATSTRCCCCCCCCAASFDEYPRSKPQEAGPDEPQDHQGHRSLRHGGQVRIVGGQGRRACALKKQT